MTDNIEDLFIVKNDIGKQNAQELAKRALKFGRITQDGRVVVDVKNLSKGDQLKLCLVIRYIGNLLNEQILKTLRPVDLLDILGQRVEAIGSRLSGLTSEGFAKREGHGEYSVYPYKVDTFLTYLENLDNSTPKKTRINNNQRADHKLTGIGAHIQNLINEGFFQTSRFISDVTSKLEEENIYRDGKVIDKTIRDIFVSKRRILQRIRHDGPGKAKWKYVIRK